MSVLISLFSVILGSLVTLIILKYDEYRLQPDKVVIKETKQSMLAKNYYCPHCGEKLNSLLGISIAPANLYGHSKLYCFSGLKKTCPSCNSDICWNDVMSIFTQKNRVIIGLRKKKI